MERWVEIAFDCLPLRSVGRLDVPLDASPKYRQLCEQVKSAIEQHGAHNTYFLYNASCVFHLVNATDSGTLEFRFHGTIFTDADDLKAERCVLEVELAGETCDWLTQPVVEWFCRDGFAEPWLSSSTATLPPATCNRLANGSRRSRPPSDAADGFVGMYL